MVASFLQSELAEELKAILTGFRLKKPEGGFAAVNIYEQYLPMPEPGSAGDWPPEVLESGLAEGLAEPEPYPYVIVRMDEGEIKDEDSAQTATVSLLIGVYDPDYQKQGHKDVLNVVAKIYERFAKFPVLNGKYLIQYPIVWALQEEESYPFYFGGMNLKFEIAAIRREDPYS